jgi:hypothetical protein
MGGGRGEDNLIHSGDTLWIRKVPQRLGER